MLLGMSSDAPDGAADGIPTLAVSLPGTASSHAPSVSQPSGGSWGRAIDVPAPESVLRRSEIEQTRRTALSGVLFNTIGVVAAPFFGGDPLAKQFLMAGLVLAWLNNAWLWYISAEHRYRQTRVVAYFAIAPIHNACILYYMGVFGPLLPMFVLNVYTACLAYRRQVAIVTLVGSIAPVFVLGGLMTLGVLEDPGLVTAGPILGAAGSALVVLAFALFMVLTYAQARESRELLVASLIERDTAVRLASHREALFVEARQDLERALHAGGLGRFTDQVLGSYELGAILGRGGMGEVYEAVHVETGTPAAVKMLLPEALGRPELVRRFLREVRIAASIESPHVVRVLEVGAETAPIPFLAMERLQGEDLAQVLRREGRLHPTKVLRLVREVGRGITAASEVGIVHRDLKPQNLFLTEGRPQVWKILDFGVSKLLEAGETLTQGEMVGTPYYMAPEQARGEAVDLRTDLYALGAVAYRALTGHQPFPGKESAAILVDVLEKMPIRPGALARLAPDVDLVLAIAMAKRPEDRFDATDVFAYALEGAIRGRLEPQWRQRGRALTKKHPWQERAALEAPALA
jgi:eukaryotic-like serine/threonine-protein kinase